MSEKVILNQLGRISTDEYKMAAKMPVIIILDNVRSLHNVGSVFRTSDAFRIEQLVLCGITGTPPHKELHKTALGATESVDWVYENHTSEAILKLKEKDYTIYAIEQTKNSTLLNQTSLKNKVAFIFGNEVSGVSDEVINMSDGVIEIPQFGTKHSFNVATTVGLILWEFYRQNPKI